jgi:SUMO ligase MMS21 Smc5/6 complex component
LVVLGHKLAAGRYSQLLQLIAATKINVRLVAVCAYVSATTKINVLYSILSAAKILVSS